MLEELGYVLKLAEKGGWPLARDVFAEVMHLIETTELWTAETCIMHVRINASVGTNQKSNQTVKVETKDN